MRRRRRVCLIGFPRSRGDEPKIPINKLFYKEFSPLTRG